MKKIYNLITSLGLAVLAVSASAQSHNMSVPAKMHKARTFQNYHQNAQRTMGGGATFLMNYDSADATAWSSMYIHNQGSLFNTHYAYPADTVGGNVDVINYTAVAFDSLYDAYTSTGYAASGFSGVTVDTLLIPLVHVNNSGITDTLDVQLNSVDANGYPTTTILKDTMIIGTKISDTNSDRAIGFVIIPENYTLSTSTKFAVTMKYMGAKTDSCWFIYGFGWFSDSCAGGGPYTLAQPTHFSTVKATSSFQANSFCLFNQYKTAGTVPTKTGANLFYDCNGDSKFTGGTDGDNYIENVNVYAQVTTIPVITGVNEVVNGLSVAQNAPNPFNKTTQINYSLDKASDVVFSVYDMTGRKLVDNTYGNVATGKHVISLNANEFTPGVYFYTFKVNGNTVTKRMVITE